MAAKTRVGLDIGSTSIRAAETARGKHGLSLTGFATVDLPAGAVSGGVIHDDQVVIDALRSLWAARRLHSKRVVLGVTHRQVVVREMSVSNLPDSQLRASLPFQVRQVLPMPVEHSLLDFHRLREHASGSTVRGLLIAAPKEPVLTMVRTTERAGLSVQGVDLASFALLRSASQLDETVEALVDIGAYITAVVVHCDGEPLIVRTIPRGGQEITDAIAKRLSIEPDRAEAMKREIGLGKGEGEEGGRVALAIQNAIKPLVNEIRSSFAYLTSSEQHSRVARLSLTGGGAQLIGLAQTLAEQLGVAVGLADPLARLATSGHESLLGPDSYTAAVSIGLALEVPR